MILLVGTGKGAWIYYGDRSRRHWRVDGPHLFGNAVSHLALDPRDGETLLLVAQTGPGKAVIFRSTDLGRSWQEAAEGVAGWQEGEMAGGTNTPDAMRLVQERIRSKLPSEVGDGSVPLVVHPRDPDTAWVFPLDGSTTSPRTSPQGRPATYRTRDGGSTWRRQDRGFPREQGWFTVGSRSFCADACEPVGLYLGTTGGELWTSRNGTRWRPLAAHLPEICSVVAVTLDGRATR